MASRGEWNPTGEYGKDRHRPSGIDGGAGPGGTSTAVDVNPALAVAAADGTDADFATLWVRGIRWPRSAAMGRPASSSG